MYDDTVISVRMFTDEASPSDYARGAATSKARGVSEQHPLNTNPSLRSTPPFFISHQFSQPLPPENKHPGNIS